MLFKYFCLSSSISNIINKLTDHEPHTNAWGSVDEITDITNDTDV